MQQHDFPVFRVFKDPTGSFFGRNGRNPVLTPGTADKKQGYFVKKLLVHIDERGTEKRRRDAGDFRNLPGAFIDFAVDFFRSHFSHMAMGYGMILDIASEGTGTADHLRRFRGDVPGNQKEGAYDLVLLQQIQYLRGNIRIGAVIKGQRDTQHVISSVPFFVFIIYQREGKCYNKSNLEREGKRKMDTERVARMEDTLNECTEAAEALKAGLERMDGLREQMMELFRYYGSEDWYRDREGEIPEGMNAGVLDEDSVYDLITDIRDEAIHMLELSTDILKNRI